MILSNSYIIHFIVALKCYKDHKKMTDQVNLKIIITKKMTAAISYTLTIIL